MISLVYIVGTGSQWEDNELRYSLRSVEKHLSGYGEIFIIGHKPDWVTGVTHLPYQDLHKNKDRNIFEKTKYACSIPEITDDFLCIHDDIFFNQRYYAPTLPYYYDGTLRELIQSRMKHPLQRNGLYNYTIWNTIKALAVYDADKSHFDTHTPIRYNKQLFPSVMAGFDWNIEHGFLVKSLYANMLNVIGKKLPDVKINEEKGYYEILKTILLSKIFSIGDRALNDRLKNVISELYNKPSKWELP